MSIDKIVVLRSISENTVSPRLRSSSIAVGLSVAVSFPLIDLPADVFT